MYYRAAIVDKSKAIVVNTIVCGDAYHPDSGMDAYPIADNSPVAIGWLRQNNMFVAPTPPKPQPDWISFVANIPIATTQSIAASQMAAAIFSRLTLLQAKPETWMGSSDRLFAFWNASTPNLSSSQKSALEALAIKWSIPARVNPSVLASDLVYVER